MMFKPKPKKVFSRSAVVHAHSLEKVPFQRLLWVIFLLNVITILLVIFSQNYLPSEVPLYYGLAEGEEQLASSISLILPPILALGITLLNLSLTIIIKDDFLQKLLILTSLVASVFSTITITKIILLVGSFPF